MEATFTLVITKELSSIYVAGPLEPVENRSFEVIDSSDEPGFIKMEIPQHERGFLSQGPPSLFRLAFGNLRISEYHKCLGQSYDLVQEISRAHEPGVNLPLQLHEEQRRRRAAEAKEAEAKANSIGNTNPVE